MQRQPDGVCAPTLVQTEPTRFFRDEKGALQAFCPPGFQRDKNNQCQSQTQTPSRWTTKPGPLQVGPKKTCPTDKNDKWDDDYLTRNKDTLPKEPKVIYVDSTATGDGEGSKSKPYPTIQQAIDKAPKNAVILVAPGTYTWGITITKDLHLVGRCTQGVKLVPSATAERPGISAFDSSVHIEGLSLLGRGQTHSYGIHSLGKLLVVRDVRVEKAVDIGISIVSGSSLINQCEVTGTVGDALGNGIRVSTTTGPFALSRSYIHDNARVGLFLQSRDPIDVSENLFVGSSSSPSSIGILSRILATGIEIKTLRIANNNFQSYQTAFHCNDNRAILFEKNWLFQNKTSAHIEKNPAKTLFSSNVFLNSQKTAIHANQVLELTLANNVIEATEPDKAAETGVLVTESTGKTTLRRNVIQSCKIHGVRIEKSTGIAMEENVLRNNGQATAEGSNVSLQENKESILLRFNHIQGGGFWGIVAHSNQDMTLYGNTILSNGKQNEHSAGIFVSKNLGTLTLQLNWLTKNSQQGVKINDTSDIIIDKNRIENNGEQVEGGLGFSLTRSTGVVTENLLQGSHRGAHVTDSPKDTTLKLQRNMWVNNMHAGLSLLNVQGKVTIQNDSFVGNGNAHLHAVNQRGPLSVEQSSFVGATSSKGIASLGQTWSEGTGIWAGALGLVRHVFARHADELCSPTQQGLLPALKDGLSVRARRVPYALDTCQSWNNKLRTEKERREEAACFKQCGNQRGCRWEWKLDESLPKKKIWNPTEKPMLCVANTEAHTCNVPVSSTSPIQSVYHNVRQTEQCLVVEKDPCLSPEMILCNTRLTTKNERQSYCRRSEVDGVLVATCVTWNDDDTTCRPNPKEPTSLCPESTVCIASRMVSIPMNPFPSTIALKKNTFWSNPGPDVVLDMAGHVQLDDNRYHPCNPATNTQCKLRMAYQVCKPTTDNATCLVRDKSSQIGYQPITLPPGKTVVWQKPSPYVSPFDSKLEGSDLKPEKTSVVFHPSLCQELATQ